MRINNYIKESCVDGEGIRFVIFTQGCKHHCKGCHNPETWPFKGGYEISVLELFDLIKSDPLINGVTFSGGEPFEQQEELTELAKMIHSIGLNIWCYTGYTYEQVQNTELIKNIDVLVDGKFIEELKCSDAFKGSSNQRILKFL
jgi:anaerobic ribonucleoside-triphosphate reductase activating protein